MQMKKKSLNWPFAPSKGWTYTKSSERSLSVLMIHCAYEVRWDSLFFSLIEKNLTQDFSANH